MIKNTQLYRTSAVHRLSRLHTRTLFIMKHGLRCISLTLALTLTSVSSTQLYTLCTLVNIVQNVRCGDGQHCEAIEVPGCDGIRCAAFIGRCTDTQTEDSGTKSQGLYIQLYIKSYTY